MSFKRATFIMGAPVPTSSPSAKFRSLLHQLTRSVSFRLCRRKLRLQHLWHVLLGLRLLLCLHVVHRSLPFRIGKRVVFRSGHGIKLCFGFITFLRGHYALFKEPVDTVDAYFSAIDSGFGFLPHFVGSLQLLLRVPRCAFSFKALACSAACA